jgi:hypothetical protein
VVEGIAHPEQGRRIGLGDDAGGDSACGCRRAEVGLAPTVPQMHPAAGCLPQPVAEGVEQAHAPVVGGLWLQAGDVFRDDDAGGKDRKRGRLCCFPPQMTRMPF